jgi:hypothetical protein
MWAAVTIVPSAQGRQCGGADRARVVEQTCHCAQAQQGDADTHDRIPDQAVAQIRRAHTAAYATSGPDRPSRIVMLLRGARDSEAITAVVPPGHRT